MYQKILVAIDNSAISNTVFKQALDLAKAMQSTMLLVHSLSGEDESSPIPLGHRLDSIYWAPGTEINLETWKAEWRHYEAHSLEQLQQLAGEANAAGVKTEFRQLLGRPGKVICTAAQQWDADLIVMGSHGRSGLTEMMLGSVSNYVMHQAPCTVLVLKSST
jgi:nucleotide-binding universal stress UspA family protein